MDVLIDFDVAWSSRQWYQRSRCRVFMHWPNEKHSREPRFIVQACLINYTWFFHKILSDLHLGTNQIGIHGAKALANLLEKNTVNNNNLLTFIILYYRQFDYLGTFYIEPERQWNSKRWCSTFSTRFDKKSSKFLVNHRNLKVHLFRHYPFWIFAWTRLMMMALNI